MNKTPNPEFTKCDWCEEECAHYVVGYYFNLFSCITDEAYACRSHLITAINMFDLVESVCFTPQFAAIYTTKPEVK